MNTRTLQKLVFLLLCLTLIATLGAEEQDSLDTLIYKTQKEISGLSGVSTLAVLDIRNIDGQDSTLGNYIEGKLTDSLVRETRLTVVERSQLEQVFEEWELGFTGVISQETMYRIGEMVGADVGEGAAGVLAVGTPLRIVVVCAARAEDLVVLALGRRPEPAVPVEPGLDLFTR